MIVSEEEIRDMDTGKTNWDDLENPSDLRAPAAGPTQEQWDAEVEMHSRRGQIAATGRPAETFPCQSCNGTGRWTGGRNQRGETKCFACKGVGHFKKSRADRERSKERRADRKLKAKTAVATDFETANPGLMASLRAIADWNSFAADLVNSFLKYGSLTEKQVGGARQMLSKVAERARVKAATAETKSGELDASKIQAMFDKARASGLKKPAFTADGIKFSLASMTGKNPGAIYVRVRVKADPYDGKLWDDVYAGKIAGGRFVAVSSAPAETLQRLQVVAQDPQGAAVAYGRLTGSCSCCGRTLTDPDSVAAGIGPICAGGWF